MEPAPIHPTPAPSNTTRRPLVHTDDLDRFDAISAGLGNIGTTAQRFHALLEWVEQQLESNPTQAAVVLPVVSDQAKTLAWLTEEISSLRQQLASAQQETEAGRAWRSERSLMQAKIDSLTGENQTLRRRLERFDCLRQALMGGSDPQSPDTSSDASQTSPEAPGATQPNESTITVAPAQRRPASAQERAARIWQAVQDWNNSPNRPQPQKVALTASTLEKRFGIYRPAAQQFMANHQTEIEAHTQTHSITAPAHNRGVPDQVWEMLKERAADLGDEA
jgi:hypothetical protein